MAEDCFLPGVWSGWRWQQLSHHINIAFWGFWLEVEMFTENHIWQLKAVVGAGGVLVPIIGRNRGTRWLVSSIWKALMEEEEMYYIFQFKWEKSRTMNLNLIRKALREIFIQGSLGCIVKKWAPCRWKYSRGGCKTTRQSDCWGDSSVGARCVKCGIQCALWGMPVCLPPDRTGFTVA